MTAFRSATVTREEEDVSIGDIFCAGLRSTSHLTFDLPAAYRRRSAQINQNKSGCLYMYRETPYLEFIAAILTCKNAISEVFKDWIYKSRCWPLSYSRQTRISSSGSKALWIVTGLSII